MFAERALRMQFAAVSVNFDSLGEAYGFPENFRDPTFFEISERLLSLSRKYDFPYTIFVIGKDLEKPENRERVGQWAREGHEIGNHSWSHPLNLGALPPARVREEGISASMWVCGSIRIRESSSLKMRVRSS